MGLALHLLVAPLPFGLWCMPLKGDSTTFVQELTVLLRKPFQTDPALGNRQPDTLCFLHNAVKSEKQNRAHPCENEVLFSVLSPTA